MSIPTLKPEGYTRREMFEKFGITKQQLRRWMRHGVAQRVQGRMVRWLVDGLTCREDAATIDAAIRANARLKHAGRSGPNFAAILEAPNIRAMVRENVVKRAFHAALFPKLLKPNGK